MVDYFDKHNTDKITGFTLLEVLVAMSIIAISLTAIYHLQTQTIAMAGATRFYTIAPMLAQQKLAEIEASSEAAEVEEDGEFSEDFAGYAWKMSMEDVESESLEEEVQNLKRIDITISLNENEFSYSLRSYKFIEK